jgi:5'-nucleotidase/UDP-sugar diphosphatase
MKSVSFLTGIVLLCLIEVAAFAAQHTTVTLLHFSDYHSHAVPFYSEGRANTAGIARAIAYLKPFADNPNTLIFSGGDTMNRGAPAWSDKYQCTEWSWWNGIVDVMALGNHDADYGAEAFTRCRVQISYPILSANTLDGQQQPLFQYEGKTYAVFVRDGVKIGVFALAGPDFERLTKPEFRPVPSATFADGIQAARQIVHALRETEHVNAVVLIGHALYEDDLALAQAIPGIDLIFGTHSHRREELTPIPGTKTVIISPFQYLTYISKVDLTFTDGTLSKVSGSLVHMSNDLPEDAEIARRVAQMQTDLETDPQYAPLFQSIGAASVELSTQGQMTGESVLGNFVMDIVRSAVQANLALSTASSFREPIPPGMILEEELRAALPYKNRLLVYTLSGAQIQNLLNYSVSRSGSDFFSQVSGVRFRIVANQTADIQILKDPANPEAGYGSLNPAATYTVATTDFQGLVASGYKEIFAGATYQDTSIDVRDQVRGFIQAHSPVAARLDGRITAWKNR